MSNRVSTYQKIKLTILSIFSIVLLIILYNHSENGRFQFKQDSMVIIIDTRNGDLYIPNGEVLVDISDFQKEENKE